MNALKRFVQGLLFFVMLVTAMLPIAAFAQSPDGTVAPASVPVGGIGASVMAGLIGPHGKFGHGEVHVTFRVFNDSSAPATVTVKYSVNGNGGEQTVQLNPDQKEFVKVQWSPELNQVGEKNHVEYTTCVDNICRPSESRELTDYRDAETQGSPRLSVDVRTDGCRYDVRPSEDPDHVGTIVQNGQEVANNWLPEKVWWSKYYGSMIDATPNDWSAFEPNEAVRVRVEFRWDGFAPSFDEIVLSDCRAPVPTITPTPTITLTVTPTPTETPVTPTPTMTPTQAPMIAACALQADHYGDPGGLARLTAWIEGQNQTAPITAITINWDGIGTVNYPNQNHSGPWTTNEQFEIRSRPEIHDVGFGAYKFEAWVTVEGAANVAYCEGTGNAEDHDNTVFHLGVNGTDNAKANEFFNGPSNPDPRAVLPTVPQLDYCADNTQCSMNVYGIEFFGHQPEDKLGEYKNNGEPEAKPSMAELADWRKLDGWKVNSCYMQQVGQHGPIYALSCRAADANPTTLGTMMVSGGLTYNTNERVEHISKMYNQRLAYEGWIVKDWDVARCLSNLGPITLPDGRQINRTSPNQNQVTGELPNIREIVRPGFQGLDWSSEDGLLFSYARWPAYMQQGCNSDGSLK